MALIELNQVSVAFPVYSAGSRSLKKTMLAATTGGRIGNDAKHVVIQALDQVSLQLNDGDRLALIGHNGAGKTTILDLLSGLLPADDGAVWVGDLEVTRFSALEGKTWNYPAMRNGLLFVRNATEMAAYNLAAQ